MEWTEVFQIIAAIILSLGGASAIIYSFSSFFGRIWADRYLESIKAENQRQLEDYKNRLEIIREAEKRYYSSQFIIYNDIYRNLYNLKIAADRLWEEANTKNLTEFYDILNTTNQIIQKNSLIIEDEHLNQLNILFQTFNNFEVGKRRLVELLKNNKLINDEIMKKINNLIAENAEIKENYDNLLKSIRINFRTQMFPN